MPMLLVIFHISGLMSCRGCCGCCRVNPSMPLVAFWERRRHVKGPVPVTASPFWVWGQTCGVFMQEAQLRGEEGPLVVAT